ncbi:MAG: hypothetical protein LC624_01310, partial [Halobacteriales archaeon]|nr:hypothetical protein [Halobacteriales archaeon]
RSLAPDRHRRPGLASADHETFLVGSDSATQYGDAAHLRAQLWTLCGFNDQSTCPVNGAQVDFYVDGAYVGTDISDAGGYADLLASSQDWHVGTHVVTAQYDRFTTPSTPATVDSTLTVVQEATATTASRGYLQAQLLDDENAALVGFPVRFYVTDPLGNTHDICTAYTDATGTARCLPVTGAGLSQANLDATRYTASFDGSGDFVASDGSANLA